MSANSNFLCGFSFWHPEWMQKFATTRAFIAVYGILGTVQAMGFIYFVMTLTTLEKRFKIPSYTTGLILSGNEISQILLSLILTYIGGHRNRPRWIAWGVMCCAFSCFILASPHFIYGAGDEALKLTKEFIKKEEEILLLNSTLTTIMKNANHLCFSTSVEKECDYIFSYVPLILIFMSQFVLGIGNTLYYSLGLTYLDDNTKKTNTPLMLAYAFALRSAGPLIGFVLGYFALKIYVDPSKTPIVDSKDPRWLGAWWLGWIVLGVIETILSIIIGLFPKELPKKQLVRPSSEIPKILINNNAFGEESLLDMADPIQGSLGNIPEIPKMKDFPRALMRLLKNKLLMYNTFATVFYILGSTGYITFLNKYIEVQFHKSTAEATIFVGPLTLMGIVFGFLISGIVISKYKPPARILLLWNIVVGLIIVAAQFSYMLHTCPDGKMPLFKGALNLSTSCNLDCKCDGIPYSPVCQEQIGETYFSACHAGCHEWSSEERYYRDCSCYDDGKPMTTTLPSTTVFDETTALEDLLPRKQRDTDDELKKMIPGACLKGCALGFYIFSATTMIANLFGTSGKIGNVLVNYRCVSIQDKSFTQGLILMMISLFALIPGPIMYGKIIDSTCLVWTEECEKNGNCQLYDQKLFRYYMNITAACMTAIAVVFDVLVWKEGKNLDLYGDREAQLQQKEGVHGNRTLNKNLHHS